MKSNLIENPKMSRIFKEGKRVAFRDYLSKNYKWSFGTVIKKLENLCYSSRLENGKVWKQYVNQMRTIGDSVLKNKDNLSLNFNDDPGEIEETPSDDTTVNTLSPPEARERGGKEGGREKSQFLTIMKQKKMGIWRQMITMRLESQNLLKQKILILGDQFERGNLLNVS